MKTSIKTFACAAIASIAFLACDDIGTNNNTEPDGSISSSSSELFSSIPSSSSVLSSSSSEPFLILGEKPVRDSRLVSYRELFGNCGDNYTMQQIGYEEWYGAGFVTDEKILKLWFPYIFNDEYVRNDSLCNDILWIGDEVVRFNGEYIKNAECNYFAYYSTTNSTSLNEYYEILSQNRITTVMCTRNDNSIDVITGDFVRRAMLICDDKDWTLKESIEDVTHDCNYNDLSKCVFYRDPNWICNFDQYIAPDWKEIYF